MANYPQRRKKEEPVLDQYDDGSSYVAKQKEFRAATANAAAHSTEHKAEVAREKRRQEKLMLKSGGKIDGCAIRGKTRASHK